MKGTLEKRAKSSDEVLFQITPAFRTFGRLLSVGPPEKEILRNSHRSCPLISNVELSGQASLFLVLFRSRARRSNTYEVLGRQWDRVNVVVLGWILNSISEELFLGLIFSKRAKHVWDELKETYDKVDGSVTFSLHHKIHTLSQNGSSIADYYHKLNALWKQFDALIELPRSAYAIISSEESHRIATGSVCGTSHRSQTSAFNVNAPNIGNFKRSQTSTSFSRPSNNNKHNDNRNRRTAGGSTLVCENCGFNGHSIDKCFKIIGYLADFGKRKVGSNFKGKNVSNNTVGSSSSNRGDEQTATLISIIKENYVNGKGVHFNMVGTYMNSSILFNKNFEKYFCSNSSLHSKLVSKVLITDSCANQHITYTDKNLINVIDISYLKIKVTHPNGTEAFITRIRNMSLIGYLTLYDVLVVPEYFVSLMSVHKVDRDSKLVIAFDEMHCYVMNQDLGKGKILGTGKQIDGLYYFDGNQGINFENFKSKNVCFLSKQVWHCRLGHPADQVLDVLRHTLSFDNKNTELICDTYQRAKQTREPFPLSDHVSTELGELVHLDLWGPYKVTSREGFKYFLTIVDDFSRAVWATCSYTPQQNRIIERKHRHLLNVARSLLFQGGIPLNMWTECVLTDAYLINRLPTSVLNEKSPYDLVYNRPPSLKHLRSFGCLDYATILNNHDKFGSRSEKYALVRYSNSKKVYKLWSLDNKQVIYSRDVKFFEDIFPFKQKSSTGIDKSVQDIDHLNFFNFNTLDDLLEIPNDEERRNPIPIRHDASASKNESFAADEDKNNSSEGNGLHDQTQDNEIVDLPVGRKAIGSKWVWKIKYKSDGEIERYKARLVAKGFNQREGIVFDETFSPFVKIVTVKCLINLDVQSDWSLFQMDINYAFLYGDLEETVYMTLPPGYFPDNETKVCKLNKSIYGLKQALRQWNAKLTATLLENNFVQSKSDYSLFTKSFGDVFIALLVYVDDIIITGNSLAEIEKVKQFLKTKFMIKDLGKLKYFLGIEVLDTPKGICLNQRKYCLELIDEFGLLDGKPSNLPMQPNICLTSEPIDTDPLLDNVTEYQKLIGKLIYLTTTRPDIAYTVSCLSQFMHNPLKSHLKTALKVIRYLKGSLGKGINVIKGSASSIDLKAYSDADWARRAYTRRSITCYCVFMCGSLVLEE
ncbi:ribonuclease H-like domain-containing protein [Tanacetum coccineum]|uniref:Ribonuclease H-like domain-containing protein n=1 Tax=Tanacetum coccineum TaxID=301880 RepID=A0ABQ5AB07_9ASTR